MKIIFFNRNKEITSILEQVENPVPYGLGEVRWEMGGHTVFEGNYIILEDTVNFSEVTDEEFLRQYKEQAKYDLAKKLEEKRVYYMVQGNLAEKEQQFVEDKATIDSKTSVEEIDLFLLEVRQRSE
jgi:hypothetical protein